MTINEIISRLEQEYGALEWRPLADPLSVLIETILSQNTSDVNSHRAFDRLIDTFGTWERLAEAGVDDIAEAIRGGGLNRIKAARIKGCLESILESRGRLDLGFLALLPSSEAKAWLEKLPGVGPKTAACVLLLSLGKPALPVDTHVYRVSRRLGLIDSKVSPEEAHQLLEAMVPEEKRYEFHFLMLAQGRKVCRARRPLCHECVFQQQCPKVL
jgi:endonuclease-3